MVRSDGTYHYYRGCRMITKGLLIGLAILLLLPIRAQELAYQYFGLQEGLSSRLVTDIIYDQEGLVWVGTENGLNRFDGYDFVNFRANESVAEKYRISHNYVRDLGMAQNGEIVIFYEDLYSSFDFIDPLTFSIRKIEVTLEVEGQPRLLYVDAQGDIFAVAIGENFMTLSQFNFATNHFEERFRASEHWNDNYPDIQMLRLHDGRFLVYDQEHGFRLFTPEGAMVKRFDPYENGLDSLASWPAQLSCFYQSRNGTVWLAYQNRPGLFSWNGQTGYFEPYLALPQEAIYGEMWEDEKGNLLVNEASFLGDFPVSTAMHLIREGGQSSDFSDLLQAGDYIVAIASRNFFNSLLIGTDTGLKVVQSNYSQVEHYLAQDIGDDFRGYSMRGITGDGQGNVYFAREVEHWYHLDVETNVLDTITLYDEEYGRPLDFNCGLGLFYDPDGYLWGVSCDGLPNSPGILYRYHIADCFTTRYTWQDRFSAMHRTDQGQIWLGGSPEGEGGSQLLHFDPEEETFAVFTDEQGENPFADAYIRYILESHDELLWVGTQNGLFRVNPATREVTHYQAGTAPNSPAVEAPLADNTIFVVHEDEAYTLWIGTRNGLTSFDPATNAWESYTTKDGLASNTVGGILSGVEGGLWVSTYNGLSYFNPIHKDKSRRFFRIDGLTHSEFNRFSFYQDENGRYYFGGVNGINAFYTEDLLVNRAIPKVLLTSFSRYDSRLDSLVLQSDNLLTANEVVVESYYDYFSLNFALPIYTPIVKNQFRYKIKDRLEEGKWISLKGDRSLRYNNIKAGLYTLYVQGADPNGNWGAETLKIELRVKEVFYKKVWFITLMILVFLAVLYGLLRYRLMQKLKVERLRTQLASDLHDEVSGLLAGISLQSELLRDQVQDAGIQERLQNIRTASQRAMSKMSDVIWSIDSRRDRISDLVLRMEEHADEVLLPIDVRYNIQVQELELNQSMPANIRQDLYFIYKEAVNNVAKHAHASKVDVSIGNYGSMFEMVIRDNGTGEQKFLNGNPGRKRKGQGLANLRMRAQRLNAQLDIVNGQGYTVHLRMKKFS